MTCGSYVAGRPKGKKSQDEVFDSWLNQISFREYNFSMKVTKLRNIFFTITKQDISDIFRFPGHELWPLKRAMSTVVPTAPLCFTPFILK